jgi:CTP:molybdopterin cytidylyltransferase MocA
MIRADRRIEGREGEGPAPQSGIALVMPMAGQGSRFVRAGRTEPKPLIDIAARPAFWWAAESVRRAVPVREMVFVVLEDHVRAFAIDQSIRELYPEARVVTVPALTRGAAESAEAGVATVVGDGPIAINDCDHAFVAGDALRELTAALRSGTTGGLVGFRATSPGYSYVALDEDGVVTATVEKRAVGEFAIAGCYLFDSAQTYSTGLARYREDCRYPELYVSGIYNVLIGDGARVEFRELADHMAFGTPEELGRLDVKRLDQVLGPTS